MNILIKNLIPLLLIATLQSGCYNNAIDDAILGESFINPDNNPAQILNVIITNISEDEAIISWETDKESTTNIYYGIDETYGEISPDPLDPIADSMLHNINLTNLTPLTTYHFQIYSLDFSGNEAYSKNYTFTTLSDISDIAPPIISEVVISTLTQDMAIITWKTDEKSTANILYGEGLPFSHSAPNPADTEADSLTHSITLSNLISGVE